MAVEDQTPMRLLLEDKVYVKWLKLTPLQQSIAPTPWRVWAQKEPGGRWSKRDFVKYAEAFRFMVKLHKAGFYDYALSNRVEPYRPPLVKLKTGKRIRHTPHALGESADQSWCCYCRRPTIFAWFTKHHNLPMHALTPAKRCAICGIRFTHNYDMMRRIK
jgi:hypothetical protein